MGNNGNNYKWLWSLKDLPEPLPEPDDIKVMSVFSGGGGSTMGHKLLRHNVIANVEIDKKQNHLYNLNFNPKYSYGKDIREVLQDAKDKNLPEELYSMDFFDGSPPCSSFSALGVREKGWGKEKKFREGQASQTLDDLFFITLDLINELRPEVFCLENVKGIIQGNALTEYTHKILEDANNYGYHCQWVQVNSKDSGIPQSRTRVFFVGLDKSKHTKSQLGAIISSLNVHHKTTKDQLFGAVIEEAQLLQTKSKISNVRRQMIPGKMKKVYEEIRPDETSFSEAHNRMFGKVSHYAHQIVDVDVVHPTLTTKSGYYMRDKAEFTSPLENVLVSSFPWDYDFEKQRPLYVCGMSVPPLFSSYVTSKIMEHKDDNTDDLDEW